MDTKDWKGMNEKGTERRTRWLLGPTSLSFARVHSMGLFVSGGKDGGRLKPSLWIYGDLLPKKEPKRLHSSRAQALRACKSWTAFKKGALFDALTFSFSIFPSERDRRQKVSKI